MCVCVCVGGGGGGGHSKCNASLSQSNVQKNNRGGGGGGIKTWKNKCWNNNQVYTIKSTPKKKLDIGSPVFLYFCIHPNQITAA